MAKHKIFSRLITPLFSLFGFLFIFPSLIPVASAATNIVPNPSLETVSTTDSTLPASWVKEQSGTNNTTFSYLTTGHTGNRSLKVEMTSRTSGDSHYKFDQQTVSPSAKYDFSFYYQSNATTEVDVEITLSNGSLSYVYVGDVPASTAWKQYTATVTMPASAAKATVYATIYSVGYLITDDYSLSSQTVTQTAATPTFSPAAGTYSSAQTVTISDSTTGAKIYYTTNGTTPTTSSSVYSSPLNISSTATVKAIAVASGYTNSAVASAAYTIGTPIVATPTFSPVAGTYTGAQSVTISDATTGATIYYTTNGTTPTTTSAVYSAPLAISSTATVKAIAVASGYTNSAVASAAYTIVPAGQFTYIDDDTAWNNYNSNGSTSLSTTDYIVGKNSVKATTTVRRKNYGITKNWSAAPLNFTGKALRAYFKASDWSSISTADLTLGSDGTSLDDTYTFDIKSQLQNPANNEWIEVVMPLSAFEKWGNPNWAAINIALLELKDSGKAVSLSIDGLGYFDAGTNAGAISITFDDGWADTYTQGKTKMDAYGYKGTAFVIPSLIGTTGYMIQSQVDGLSTSGWDISGHGNTNLTTMTAAQMDSDLQSAHNYVTSKGYKGSYLYAYPNGGTNNAVMSAVNKYFTASFNINGMNQPLTYFNRSSINRQSMDKWTTVAMIEDWIDNAKKNNEWCILNFHTLVATPSNSYDFSIADFGTIIDYIYSSGIHVKPVSSIITN